MKILKICVNYHMDLVKLRLVYTILMMEAIIISELKANHLMGKLGDHGTLRNVKTDKS